MVLALQPVSLETAAKLTGMLRRVASVRARSAPARKDSAMVRVRLLTIICWKLGIATAARIARTEIVTQAFDQAEAALGARGHTTPLLPIQQVVLVP